MESPLLGQRDNGDNCATTSRDPILAIASTILLLAQRPHNRATVPAYYVFRGVVPTAIEGTTMRVGVFMSAASEETRIVEHMPDGDVVSTIDHDIYALLHWMYSRDTLPRTCEHGFISTFEAIARGDFALPGTWTDSQGTTFELRADHVFVDGSDIGSVRATTIASAMRALAAHARIHA